MTPISHVALIEVKKEYKIIVTSAFIFLQYFLQKLPQFENITANVELAFIG